MYNNEKTCNLDQDEAYVFSMNNSMTPNVIAIVDEVSPLGVFVKHMLALVPVPSEDGTKMQIVLDNPAPFSEQATSQQENKGIKTFLPWASITFPYIPSAGLAKAYLERTRAIMIIKSL